SEKHYFISSATTNANVGGYTGFDALCNSDANTLAGRTYHVYGPKENGRGFMNGYVYSNKAYGTFALAGTQDPDLCRIDLAGNCDTSWKATVSGYTWDTGSPLYCSGWQSTSGTGNAPGEILSVGYDIPGFNTDDIVQCASALKILCIEDTVAISDPQMPFLVETPASWSDARSYCISQGAHLAYISDSAEQEYFKSLSGGNEAWIGLNDLGSEGTFRWEHDNSPPSYFLWAPGQPDNYAGNEDCVGLTNLWPGYEGRWNDNLCTNQQKYMCRY
ncbi:MAG: hypothetical protein COV79_05405, partial [Parcubacteria group bacterium CG11_big_fil_rev_8_21_14_0_20_41_14]